MDVERVMMLGGLGGVIVSTLARNARGVGLNPSAGKIFLSVDVFLLILRFD